MCSSFKYIIIHKKAKNWENAQTVSLNYRLKARYLHSGSKAVTSGAEQVNLVVYAEKSPSQLAFINKYYINISVVSGRLCEDR